MIIEKHTKRINIFLSDIFLKFYRGAARRTIKNDDDSHKVNKNKIILNKF